MGMLGRLYIHEDISAPFVFARKALRVMNTNYLTAFGAGPPFLFVSNELSYANLPYTHEIVNHTHAVFCSVPRVEAVQPVAGVFPAIEAILQISGLEHFALFYPALCPGFRLPMVIAPATRARVLFPDIGATEATVHTAGGDQRRSDRIFLY